VKPKDAAALISDMRLEWTDNREKVAKVDRWYRGRLIPADLPDVPKEHQNEAFALIQRALGQWLRLVVRVVAQQLYIEGYRDQDGNSRDAEWNVWRVNRFNAKQSVVYRAALAHGMSYVAVLPGKLNGEPMPKLVPKSALRTITFWEDPVDDEWPMYALEGELLSKPEEHPKRYRWTLWTPDEVWKFDDPDTGSDLKLVDHRQHRLGVVPFVRFAADMDVDGRADGEVKPFIDMAARINQTVFDRLAVQRWGAFVVRWAADVEPDDDETITRFVERLKVSGLLISENENARFGSLPATPLDGYIRATQEDIKQFAAVTQTPPHALLGDLINLSADALAAAETGLARKVTDYKHSFGENHEQLLRQVAWMIGEEPDVHSEVVWADLESRSLAQVADALVKLAKVGVPNEYLWSKLPGATPQDIDRWKEEAAQQDALTALFGEIADAGQVLVEE